MKDDTSDEAENTGLPEFSDLPEKVFEMWHGIDTATLGRVLRAHLMVEHHVTAHLASRNAHLAGIWDAHIDLSQKLKLMGDELPKWLRKVITELSELRNKFAHRLNYQLTETDVGRLRKHGLVKGMVEHAEKRPDGVTPLDVFEFACVMVAILLSVGTTIREKLDEYATAQATLHLRGETISEFFGNADDEE